MYICIYVCVYVYVCTYNIYIYILVQSIYTLEDLLSRHHLTTAPSTSSTVPTTNALNLLSYQPPQPHQPTKYIYIYITYIPEWTCGSGDVPTLLFVFVLVVMSR